MKKHSFASNLWLRVSCLALAGLLLPMGATAENDDSMTGEVELLYRNVSQDGSTRKYNEDFDGLESGGRLSNLSLDWISGDSNLVDFARLDVSGLGGDPFEKTAFKIGRKDGYELSFSHQKQEYMYNLFELIGDEDGATWDTTRRFTDLGLKIYPHEKVTLFFGYQDGQRSGDSVFMKDINRQLFRLEAPLDQQVKKYTVGANIEAGPVDIVFRQTLRRYDNRFHNTTEGDPGLSPGGATLQDYDWLQRETGGSDWTTLKVSSPLGDRVNLTVSLFGTFIGEEEIKSRVNVDADGTTYTSSCSLSGVSCASDADCAPVSLILGDVCVANPFTVAGGFSNADLEGDTTLIDADVSVRLAKPLDLHLQYRSLDRDISGTAERDLENTGTPTSVAVTNDYSIDTITATLHYRPVEQVGLRAGYRMIDRMLDRNGFDPGLGFRNTDYDSGDDATLIFGVVVKPVKWFRLNADLEDGDIDQPFNGVAPSESQHTRVRASFLPKGDMKIDLAYLDSSKENTAPDLRFPSSNWDSHIDNSTLSASFFHKANENVSYTFRYAEQEIDSSVGIVFDTPAFGGPAAVEDGDSIFDTDNTQLSGQVNFGWLSNWKGHVGYWMTESDGNNSIIGDTSGVVNSLAIDQEFTNIEAGVTYSFDSGIFVGVNIRDFDYDDLNDLLDYDGQIVEFLAGTRF